jgi:protein phosphatase
VSAHAGDCRIYQYRPGSQPRAGGGLWRLTLDHDYFASLQREGLGPAAAAEAASVHSNVITRALGLREEVGVEVQYLRADAGDLFLLCSDGLTRQLTDSRIQAILAEDDQSLAKRCRRLLRAADEERGSDNVTAVLLRLG